ncbi:sclerostin domain-containing protein 1a [Hippocampus comes]|uniref:sclerostin domain-containing protein 1a n=1 Tax=Hippocampus comes TaxID=109280 RepID=UPI00094ECA73|nr:PREDICTED: sclerostin domain-containing protein 1 [Hippocampus comes]
MHQESFSHSLLLLCILLRSSQALNNDATEHAGGLLPEVGPPQEDAKQGNVSLNRARAGGRAAGRDRSERSQMGCRELRSTKYISDGHCTSIHPIKELVCAGECLPAQMLHNWIGGTHQSKKFWTRHSTATGSNPDWRCVNDKTRTQRIRLQCQDGSTRTYKITVVTSCKCKRFSRQNNESDSGHKFGVLVPPQTQLPHKSKSRKSLGKKHMSQNWHQTAP